MDLLMVIALPLAAVALVLLVVIYVRRKTGASTGVIVDGGTVLIPIKGAGISIPIERLSALSTVEDSGLAEISDTTVVSKITSLIPHGVQVAASQANRNLTGQALSQVETLSKGDIFRVIIPSGAKLDPSREIEGAYRASYRIRDIFGNARSRIKGQANLEKISVADLSKAKNASAVANSVANVMNITSLVVGQYYMSEINDKLETMSKNINKIVDFQEREFKSRIMSLMTLVGEISHFSVEIIENDELRLIKLSALEDRKASATELLGQVNETIAGILQNNPNPDYKTYQANVEDLFVLFGYQNILVAVLEEISKLTYLLGKGGISMDMSYALFNKFWDMSAQIRRDLRAWHRKQVLLHGIDISNSRKPKNAMMDFFAGFIDCDWMYRDLKFGLADKITAQTQTEPHLKIEQNDIFEEDVEIIVKDGKYYYRRDSYEN